MKWTNCRSSTRTFAHLVFVAGLLSFPMRAAGTEVQYLYSATVSVDFSGLFYAGGEAVSGSFGYDSSAVSVSGPSPTVYLAMSNLTGSINGDSFSDPSGAVLVWNNSFGPSLDNILLIADGTTMKNLSGFQLIGGGSTFNLTNVHLFLSPGEILTDESLPVALPSPGAGTNVTFEFTNTADSDDSFEVWAGLNFLVVVPVPASIWLFGSALVLIGWARREIT